MESLVIPLFVALLVLGIREIFFKDKTRVQPQEKQPEAIPKLNSILNEVENNEELLNKGYDTNKWGHRKYLYRLIRDAFDNAKSTENFNSLSAPIQKALSSYYERIDRWNELVNKHEGEQEAVKLQGIFNKHDALKTTLRKVTDDLKGLLKSEE